VGGKAVWPRETTATSLSPLVEPIKISRSIRASKPKLFNYMNEKKMKGNVAEWREIKLPSTLLTLPVELLVYIFAFLATPRDKAKLRYVSRALRNVIEIPSLWSEFVWPNYDSREEFCVCSLLKSCGGSMKRLLFPDHVPPPLKLVSMFQNCKNVIELSLPTTKLDIEQLRKIVQYMRQLRTLDVQWNINLVSLLSIGTKLEELTVRLVIMNDEFEDWESSLSMLIENWVSKMFTPQNINIHCKYMLHKDLLKTWSQWNPCSPTGSHVGCIRVYDSSKVPLDLFHVMPVFQLQFGQGVMLPLLDASKIGGRGEDLLLLTDCSHGSRVAYKLREWRRDINTIQNDQLNCDISGLKFVTECDLSSCKFDPVHLEQLAVMCPNLNRLDLSENNYCLKSLQGLHALSDSCHNLEGLNLLGIKVTEVENHMQLWEIICNMRLTHLAIDLCILMPFEDDDRYKRNLIRLYQKCSRLQALLLGQIGHFDCPNCDSFTDSHIVLLSYFPILSYCKLSGSRGGAIVESALTSCSKLTCFNYFGMYYETPLSFSAHLNFCNLQQLYLQSGSLAVPESFMKAVSAHGGLVHIILFVKTVAHAGIVSVIAASHKLLTLHIIAYSSILEDLTINLNDFKSQLKKRFSHRRLFNSGSFETEKFPEKFPCDRVSELVQLNIDVTENLWD